MRACTFAVLGPVLALVPSRAFGQSSDCSPPKSSNEARTLAIFSVPLAFGAAQSPEAATAGRLRLGVELSYLPNVDPATATPTFCRPDKHLPENTDLLFAAPRPRVGLTLGAGFALEASWIPPVRFSGVRANLIGVALSRATRLGRYAVLALRAHGTFGDIRAPITCDQDAIRNPLNTVCYQGTVSDDSYRPNIFGADAALGWSLGGGRVQPYVGAGYNRLQPRFQVNFTDALNQTDRRRVVVDLDRAVLFAGATWQPAGGLGISGEIYSAPSDAVTGRVAVRVGLGR